MLTVEGELTVAIYFLYFIDCIHWLKPGEIALTRSWGGYWKTHSFQDDSYTLLGRMPVFVNPIDLRPSFVSGSVTDLGQFEGKIAELVPRCAPDTKIITLLTSIGAANLLGFLPILLVSGYFGAWWRIPLCLALSIQFCLAFEIYEQGAPWRAVRRGDFWQHFISIALNPLAALRSGDMLLKGLFAASVHREISEQSARKRL
jgi:hypothetical protein